MKKLVPVTLLTINPTEGNAGASDRSLVGVEQLDLAADGSGGEAGVGCQKTDGDGELHCWSFY